RDEKPSDSQRAGHVIPAIQCRHRISLFFGFHNHDTDDRGDEAERARDQRKQNSFEAEIRIQPDSEAHSTDVLRGSRFDYVDTTARAAGAIVAYEVRDHSWIAETIFRDPRLDVAYHVR